jgi:hypothetical protein
MSDGDEEGVDAQEALASLSAAQQAMPLGQAGLPPPVGVEALRAALRRDCLVVLLCLHAYPATPASVVARLCGMPRSNAQRILQLLRGVGLVRRGGATAHGRGRWRSNMRLPLTKGTIHYLLSSSGHRLLRFLYPDPAALDSAARAAAPHRIQSSASQPLPPLLPPPSSIVAAEAESQEPGEATDSPVGGGARSG